MGQIRVSPETLQTRAREYNKASNEVNIEKEIDYVRTN